MNFIYKSIFNSLRNLKDIKSKTTATNNAPVVPPKISAKGQSQPNSELDIPTTACRSIWNRRLSLFVLCIKCMHLHYTTVYRVPKTGTLFQQPSKPLEAFQLKQARWCVQPEPASRGRKSQWACNYSYCNKIWSFAMLRQNGCATSYCVTILVVCQYRKYCCHNYLNNGYLSMFVYEWMGTWDQIKFSEMPCIVIGYQEQLMHWSHCGSNPVLLDGVNPCRLMVN